MEADQSYYFLLDISQCSTLVAQGVSAHVI